MSETLLQGFFNFGAIGVVLGWITMKLIPYMQEQSESNLKAFRDESSKEREMHERSIDKLVQSNAERDRQWMELVKELAVTKV